MPVWTSQCPGCESRVPVADFEAHTSTCPVLCKERFVEKVQRPRTWMTPPGRVNEVLIETPEGNQRHFQIGLGKNPVTREELTAFRDLLTVTLEESPEPAAPEIPAASTDTVSEPADPAPPAPAA